MSKVTAMTVSDLKDWARTGKNGSKRVYVATHSTPDEAFYRSDIMEAARTLYKQGKVLLVQKRNAPRDNCFDYIAVKV